MLNLFIIADNIKTWAGKSGRMLYEYPTDNSQDFAKRPKSDNQEQKLL